MIIFFLSFHTSHVRFNCIYIYVVYIQILIWISIYIFPLFFTLQSPSPLGGICLGPIGSSNLEQNGWTVGSPFGRRGSSATNDEKSGNSCPSGNRLKANGAGEDDVVTCHKKRWKGKTSGCTKYGIYMNILIIVNHVGISWLGLELNSKL